MSEIKVIGEQSISGKSIENMMDGVCEMFGFENGGIIKAIGGIESMVTSPAADLEFARSSGCVLPPYDAATILRYKAMDSTLQSCLDIKADTIVGLGYKTGCKDSPKKKIVNDFLLNPNDNLGETITQIFKCLYTDLDLLHNGYLEYVKSGKMKKIYYVPANGVYIKPFIGKNGMVKREIDKYIRIDDSDTIQSIFEPYSADGKTKDGVHYIIHFKKISQTNQYYGTPDNEHLFKLIQQSYLADQYNINFFSNGGQPAWAILITGGKLSSKAYEKIKLFVENNLKGVNNAHKMLFLSLPNEKAKITLVPLSKSIDEQFLSLSEKLQFRIALKKRVHPKLLGLSVGGNFGGGSAGVADLKLFLETLSNPEEYYLCEVFNRFLRLEFGIDVEFSFNSINISNEKDDAVMANLYWNMLDQYGNRVITINEIRTMFLRLKPIDLLDTVIDESASNDVSSVVTTSEGEIKGKGSSIDSGDGHNMENLDSEKHA